MEQQAHEYANAQGAADARAGWSVATCPHAEGTEEHTQWVNGWFAAKHPSSTQAEPQLSEGFRDGLAGRPMQMCMRGGKYANDYRAGARAARAAIAKAAESAKPECTCTARDMPFGRCCKATA